jgi:hypothetical protein
MAVATPNRPETKKKSNPSEDNWQKVLIKGKQSVAPRLCVYGPHGIGKSTLGSRFPKPIFITTEDGLAALDTTSFPVSESVEEVANNIKTLIAENHDFKTVVLDSVDWLVEALIVPEIERRHDPKDLAYGRGALLAADEFREILQGLDFLRRRKDMNVLLIAHGQAVRYEDPRNEAYDRFQPKIPNRCNAILQEWVDALFFAAFKVLVAETDLGFDHKQRRGVTTGERQLHTQENPAYIAKCRYECPAVINLDIDEVKKHIPLRGV